MAEMSRALGRRFAVNFEVMVEQAAAAYAFSNGLGAVSAANAAQSWDTSLTDA